MHAPWEASLRAHLLPYSPHTDPPHISAHRAGIHPFSESMCFFGNMCLVTFKIICFHFLRCTATALWRTAHEAPSARQRPQRPTLEPRRPAARRAEGGAQRPRCATLLAGQKARLEWLHDLDLLDAALQPEAKHRAAAVSLVARGRGGWGVGGGGGGGVCSWAWEMLGLWFFSLHLLLLLLLVCPTGGTMAFLDAPAKR